MLFQFPPDCLMNYFLKVFEDETVSIYSIWLIDISFKFLVTCNSSFIPILLVLSLLVFIMFILQFEGTGFVFSNYSLDFVAAMQGSIVPYISCKIQGKSDSGSIFLLKIPHNWCCVFPLGGM